MLTERLLDRWYCSRPDFVDGTSHFFGLCRESIVAGSRILEVGAGPNNRCSQFLSSLGEVTGVDVSAEVLANNSLTAASVYNGVDLPFSDHAFDACVSNYVLEHIEQPAAHFREVARVLKPGGVYCIRTPNLKHYVTIGAKLLPHAVHLKTANRLRDLDADAHDPYQTVYRANTPKAIRKMAILAGLRMQSLQMIEKEPSYGLVSPFLFVPMMLYERLVNSWDGFAPFRVNIFAVLARVRPEEAFHSRSIENTDCERWNVNA